MATTTKKLKKRKLFTDQGDNITYEHIDINGNSQGQRLFIFEMDHKTIEMDNIKNNRIHGIEVVINL